MSNSFHHDDFIFFTITASKAYMSLPSMPPFYIAMPTLFFYLLAYDVRVLILLKYHQCAHACYRILVDSPTCIVIYCVLSCRLSIRSPLVSSLSHIRVVLNCSTYTCRCLVDATLLTTSEMHGMALWGECELVSVDCTTLVICLHNCRVSHRSRNCCSDNNDTASRLPSL